MTSKSPAAHSHAGCGTSYIQTHPPSVFPLEKDAVGNRDLADVMQRARHHNRIDTLLCQTVFRIIHHKGLRQYPCIALHTLDVFPALEVTVLDDRTEHFNDLLIPVLQLLCLIFQLLVCFSQNNRLLLYLLLQQILIGEMLDRILDTLLNQLRIKITTVLRFPYKICFLFF